MKIASSVEYAARLMVRLARSYGQAAVPGEKLSESEGVPIDYVNQLLLRLRRAGLVISHRGAGGGYVLAQPPPQVNLGHIFRAVEGQVFEGVCGSMIKGSGLPSSGQLQPLPGLEQAGRAGRGLS